ncbi:hypothetical protein ACUNWD_14395 [Sunxiuqinia sp. A32]|uniref:hypothetical protein n=1 Tax=Sunxiuqinia sp. A32 TaxID=3461496 RepID=UPI004045EC30
MTRFKDKPRKLPIDDIKLLIISKKLPMESSTMLVEAKKLSMDGASCPVGKEKAPRG